MGKRGGLQEICQGRVVGIIKPNTKKYIKKKVLFIVVDYKIHQNSEVIYRRPQLFNRHSKVFTGVLSVYT